MLQITALFSIIPLFGKKSRASQTKEHVHSVWAGCCPDTQPAWGGSESRGQSCQPGDSNVTEGGRQLSWHMLGEVFVLLVLSLVSDGAVARRCLPGLASKGCCRAVKVWGLELKGVQRSKWAHGPVGSPHWTDLRCCLLWHRSLNYGAAVPHELFFLLDVVCSFCHL